MSSIFKGFIIVGMIIVLTGCGANANQIVCKSEGAGGNIEISQNYVLNYDGDKITNLKQEKVYSFEDEKAYKNFETVINSTISSMKKMENKYIKFDSKTKKNSYILELNVDVTKITDDEMNTLNINKNLKEFRKTLESQGLTCK